jgi:hypothetical protein
MLSLNLRARGSLIPVVALALAIVIVVPAAARADVVPAWDETARAWEATARKFQESGDTRAAREAWAEAALAWERAGRARSSAAGGSAAAGSPDRLNELEDAVDAVTAELAAWRRTALAWREAARSWSAVHEEAAAGQAMNRSLTALEKIAELETRLDDLSTRLAERRGSLIDMQISMPLQSELVDRWAEVARSWELTAVTWARSGEPGKAEIARLKASEIRARIRELRPDLDTAWFQTHTFPPRDESEVVSAAAVIAAGPAAETPTEPVAPAEPPPPPLTVPPLPARLAQPPDWLISREEREGIRSAEVWWQGAETWRKTALARVDAGEWEGAAVAVAKMEEAAGKALDLERAARASYARREAEISASIAGAFGETPRSEADVLTLLDAAAPRAPLPPALSGDAIALVPPPIPGTDTDARPTRGFFDLEIGGPIPSTLTIRGRKVVDFNYSVTHYPNANALRDGGNTQSSFALNQELQVEVLGRVGRDDQDHINVNIRYDDTQRGVNSVNNRNISVDFVGVPHKTRWGTYQYDFDFGDIGVSLPGSEFAFYNKSLFGAKGELRITDLDLGFLKADRVSLTVVGSQTKGVSASKEFTLNGERVPPEEFKDIQFARDRFFLIEPDGAFRPIQNVTVFRDDGIGSNNNGAIAFTASSAGAAAGFSHVGNWNILVAGQDYILNQTTAELELLTSLGPNDNVAASYAGGAASYGSGGVNSRLIRVATDSAVARDALRVHELRNRYKLSRQRIKKDDPNLIFEIRDALGFAQTTVNGVPTTYLKLFGFDRDANDKVDIELIDYDFGIIRPIDTQPFARSGNPAINNDTIYTRNDLTDADHKYMIHIEYSSDQPQEIFTLGFDIIKGSDIVYVDGVKVQRDIDYFIDYEAGIITFLNRALIKPDSKIRVDYEYLPFGGQFERTLVGSRLDVEVSPRLGFGTTLLYDFSAAADEIPSIFEDKPNQNAIVELDARMQLGSLLLDVLDRTGSSPRWASMRQNFRLDLAGEWAWASHDPNTFGAAMIEDFEAIEEVVGASMSRVAWLPASLPPADTGVLLTGLTQANRGVIAAGLRDNFGHRTQAQLAEADERQQSLQLDVNFLAGETWVAIRTPLSPGAISFENMTAMELYASSLPTGVRVYVDVGLASEDNDGDGVLDSEDGGLDGNPATDDIGNNNGVLNTGEDDGISFDHGAPGRGSLTNGFSDGALTTEDMDNDFRLDQTEAFFRLGDLNTSTEIERKNFTGFQSSAWTLYRVPWRTRTPFAGANVAVVKQLRLIVVRADGADTSFTFYMDQLTFRGNRFTGSSSDSRIVLLPRNNENDPNYQSPPRSEIKGDAATTKEQALALKWSLSAGEASTVKQGYSRAIDLGDYDRLSFFVAGDGRGETFSLFLVSDDNNYIEIRRNMATGTDLGGFLGAPQLPLWERIDVPLQPIRNATIANILGTGDTIVKLGGTAAGLEIFIVSQPVLLKSPSLSNINQVWLRIQSTVADSGEIWVDDLYAAEPLEQAAIAQKASFATGWGDLFSLTGHWRDVPGKFRGVGIINNPQTGQHEERSVVTRGLSGTLSLHRLLNRILPASLNFVLPVSASWDQTTTNLDPDRVDNALKSDLGKNVSENQQYSTSLQLWKFPTISVNYGRTTSIIDYRLEDRTSRSSNLAANTAYSYVFPQKLFGIVPTGDFLSIGSSYTFSDQRLKTLNSLTSGIANVLSRTSNQNVNVNATSRPISMLTLSYNYTTAYLDRQTLIASEEWKGITSRNHSTNATLSLPTKFGISPGVSFSGTYGENFNRATFGGKTKDIALGGDFRISVGVNPAAWTRLLSFLSVRYSYNLSSNASYRTLNTGTAINDIFGDYVGERLFPWGSSKRVNQGTGEVTSNRSSGSTNITHNVSGDIQTFNWLQTSYSAGMTRNEVASLSTLSITDGMNGTLNMRMDYNQAFPRSFIKFRSSYLTGAVSYGRTENAASRSNNLSPSVNWNAQWTDALNTTFTLGYNRTSSVSTFSPQSKQVSEGMNPGMSFTYYFDLRVPESLKLPGVGEIASLNRRVQLSGGFNANFRKSQLAEKITSEQNNYGVNLSLGYRIASNLELTASSNGSWLQDKLEKQNDFLTIGAGARVEWRF